MTGQRIAQFEITGQLGQGGMGEVFRARDTRLNRDVAIKVLPKDFAADADRLRRFEQEAKTLAALSHPNVLTVFDAGVQEGVPYLVSELLEGKTLREEMNDAALPVRNAAEFGLQIAHGLAAAHSKGVIHRDLKPENIFVTQDGRVKILDFGLAKLMENPKSEIRNPKSPVDADAPTFVESTEPGRVLGTPAYMSPEQVRGKPADHRADIFAFGCVLYEMLSGTRAFRCNTPVESMNAVLNQEPPELSARNAHVPLAIERVVRRCVEKNPDNRFQSAKDLAFAIENAGAASTANFAAAASPPLSTRLVPAIPWALAAILVVICGLVLFRKRAVVNTAQRPVPIRISLPSSQRMAFPDPVPMLAISRDGSHLAYCVKRGQDSVLFVRPLLSLTQSEALELPGTEGASAPFFSPDGRWIGFGQKGALRKITVDGAVSEDLCSLRSAFLLSGFWATDGYVYFADNYSPLSRISERGGSPEAVTQLDAKLGDVGHMFPEVLPGNKALVCGLFRMDAASNDGYWIAVARLGEKQPPKALFKGNCPHYLAPGYLVFLRLGSLYAVAFDAERLQPLGEPVPLFQIGSFFPPLGDANLSLSANGDLAYVPTPNPGWSLDFVDASSGMTESIKTGRYYDTPQFSGDGRLVLTTVRGCFDQVWICNLAQGTERQLTRGRGDNQNPYWFSNDTTVLYSWNKDGSQSMKLYSKSVTEWEKPPERLFADDGTSTDEYASSRPHDTLLLYERGAPPQRDIWLVDLHEKQKPKPLIADPKFDEWMGSFSPDGSLIAYLSNETGIQEAWVRSLDSSASTIMVSSGGASSPVWSPSGSELFFLAQTNMLSARILARPTLRSEKARVLFPVPTPLFNRRFDISPDGKRFVVVRGGSATSDEVTVIMNWLEELKKRVPLKGTGSE